MKTKIIILFFILTGIYSCRRDNLDTLYPRATVQLNTNQVQSSFDYRDTTLGTYLGTMHYIETAAFGTITVTDTLYPYTVIVTSDPTDTSLIHLGTMEATLHTNYTFADDRMMYYPHGNITGSFAIASDSLSMHYYYNWNGDGYTYQFNGLK